MARPPKRFRMSCSMTIPQVRDGSKTVTRRAPATWEQLQVGDHLVLIEKGMGLPKGAKQVAIREAVVVDVRLEQLASVTEAECAAEGFPDMTPTEFMVFWANGHSVRWSDPSELLAVVCRRIEWRYVNCPLEASCPDCRSGKPDQCTRPSYEATVAADLAAGGAR